MVRDPLSERVHHPQDGEMPGLFLAAFAAFSARLGPKNGLSVRP